MIKLYTGCLVLLIGNLIVGQVVVAIKIVKYDNNNYSDFVKIFQMDLIMVYNYSKFSSVLWMYSVTHKE